MTQKYSVLIFTKRIIYYLVQVFLCKIDNFFQKIFLKLKQITTFVLPNQGAKGCPMV